MATKERLEVEVTATDNASKKLSAISKGISGLGTAAKYAAVGGLAAAAVGVTALAVTLPKLISAGSDAEEMMGKFSVVFGEFAEGTIKDLDTMAAAMGRSKFEMRSFASSFQDTFVPMGYARDDAAELSKQLVELTYDVASFNNAQESDVARDFQSALVGNTETVRKYGIVITQTVLDQELMNMGVADGVKGATEAQKVQARLNLIMKGTTDAQGDAIRTGDSWANQMRALNAVISDTAAEIGLALLPVFTPLLSQFRSLAQEWAPKVAAVLIGQVIPAVTALVTKIAGFTGSLLDAFKEGGLAGVGAFLVTELANAWPPILAELMTWPDRFWSWLTDPQSGVLAKATIELDKFPAAVTAWADGVDFEKIGSDIGDSIIGGVTNTMGDDVTGEKVILAFLKSLGRAIISLDFAIADAGIRIGHGLGTKIAEGITDGFVKNAIINAFTSVFANLSPLGPFSGAFTIGRNILGYASGGMVPGPIGAPQLAVVHGGEMVIPAGGGGSRHDIYFHGDVPGNVDQNSLLRAVREALTEAATDARNRMQR